MAAEQISSRKTKYGKIRGELQQHHGALLEQCRKLEMIADSLPHQLNYHMSLAMLRDLLPVVKEAHAFEERRLFPLLIELNSANNNLAESIERLRFEHWEDESFAEEICDSLRRYLFSPDHLQSETLSYMLRGFFGGVRRHVAYENDCIVPLIEEPAA